MGKNLETVAVAAIRATFATPLVLTSSFVAATVYTISRKLTGLTLACKYTRATGVPGVPEMRIEWSRNGTDYYADPILDTAITASAPYGQQQAYITDILMPVPSSDSAITYLLPVVSIPPGAVKMRASFKDGAGTPGTLAVELWPGLAQ